MSIHIHLKLPRLFATLAIINELTEVQYLGLLFDKKILNERLKINFLIFSGLKIYLTQSLIKSSL
jgi:hypothetical protein